MLAPGTSISVPSASKYAVRACVAALPSLLQLAIVGTRVTVPGSILRSRSSENRWIRPKPFESDVPPFSQSEKPVCWRDQSV